MNPIGLIGSLFTGSNQSIVKQVADVADQFIQTPEEKAKFEIEMRKVVANEVKALEDAANRQFELEVADRKDARANHRHSRVPALLSFALTMIVFSIGYMLFFDAVPEENSSIAYMLFGNVITVWGSAMAYWFGTSRSSSEKTRQMRSK